VDEAREKKRLAVPKELVRLFSFAAKKSPSCRAFNGGSVVSSGGSHIAALGNRLAPQQSSLSSLDGRDVSNVSELRQKR